MEQNFQPTAKGAENYFMAKMTYTTGPVETKAMLDNGEDVMVVDVRAAQDYAKGHVPGAISLPQGKWSSFKGLSPNRKNVLYCYSHVCHLAAKAAVLFAGKGIPVMEMDGGFQAWKENHLPVIYAEDQAPGAVERLKDMAQDILR